MGLKLDECLNLVSRLFPMRLCSVEALAVEQKSSMDI